MTTDPLADPPMRERIARLRAADRRGAGPVTGPASRATREGPPVSGGLILAIESSCDETGIALIEDGRLIRANVVASQVALHAPTGGIVPEVAARAHLRWIVPVLDAAWTDAGATWDDVEAVAVTYGPGLAGSLLVGINFAKALAWVHDRPLVGVNHLEGHVYAAWLRDPGEADRPDPVFPLVALVVSGGHTFLAEMRDHLTYRLLGTTLDDAAGEAFDKVGRLLGLGYPGGPAIGAGGRGRDQPRPGLPAGVARRLVRPQLLGSQDRGPPDHHRGARRRRPGRHARGAAPRRRRRRAGLGLPGRRRRRPRRPRRSGPPRRSAPARS